MNGVSDFVSLGQYELAIKRITIANVNQLNEYGESFLMVYSTSRGYRDAPEFIEHLFAVGYELKDKDYKALAYCLDYGRVKSARVLLYRRPDWFSNKTFEYMHYHDLVGGMNWFIESGFQFKWFKSSTPVHAAVSQFYLCRERAKERAVAVLGLPRLRRGSETGVGITKDVVLIIARVVWEMRKFN